MWVAGLLDFGQSKQLTEASRLAFGRLILALAAAGRAPLMGVRSALSPRQQAEIAARLHDIGIRTADGPVGLRAQMAYGMFDTRGMLTPFFSPRSIGATLCFTEKQYSQPQRHVRALLM